MGTSMSFREFIESSVTFKYDINKFASLPWNWQSMIQAKIVNALFYYAKANYQNGKPERMNDYSYSLITLPNLKTIPANELSPVNLLTNVKPNTNDFIRMLRNPKTWYDDKIDQVYQGIAMTGKRPEDFGGQDVRKIQGGPMDLPSDPKPPGGLGMA